MTKLDFIMATLRVDGHDNLMENQGNKLAFRFFMLSYLNN